MSVPLDRLYNFLHDVCNRDDIVIYRFFPHGSRKILDLTMVNNVPPLQQWSSRYVICHDQEPLDFSAYCTTETAQEFVISKKKNTALDANIPDTDKLVEFYRKLNLRMAIDPPFYSNKPVLLVHSEKNSSNLARYEELGMVGVYWWCHAVIARDWFRHAEHDPKLDSRNPETDFLVYNRAWTGSREYRLKFVELLLNNNLENNCRTKFNPYDSGNYYRNHVFKNKDFCTHNTDLEQIFELNTIDASASADYTGEDYRCTQMEIVLETLFDDNRIQLTEKALRPIACGHPFMLVSTKGSLRYLRDYGFETFGHCINESYDDIDDPLDRLTAVVSEMRRIANLQIEKKQQIYKEMRLIAQRNKQLFFSKHWHDSIVQEYVDNVKRALVIDKKFVVDLTDLSRQ